MAKQEFSAEELATKPRTLRTLRTRNAARLSALAFLLMESQNALSNSTRQHSVRGGKSATPADLAKSQALQQGVEWLRAEHAKAEAERQRLFSVSLPRGPMTKKPEPQEPQAPPTKPDLPPCLLLLTTTDVPPLLLTYEPTN